jgi:hypothetical protein
VGSGEPLSSRTRTDSMPLSSAGRSGWNAANEPPRSIASMPFASLYEMLCNSNGLRLARSNGELDTRLERVSPQVVPRPGRAGSGSSGRRERDSSLGAPPRAALFGAARSAPEPEPSSSSACAGGGTAGAGASIGNSLVRGDGSAGKALGLESALGALSARPLLRASGASLTLQAAETMPNARIEKP